MGSGRGQRREKEGDGGEEETYDEPGVACGVLKRGLKGLAADVVPVARETVKVSVISIPTSGEKTVNYTSIGPSLSRILAVSVIL